MLENEWVVTTGVQYQLCVMSSAWILTLPAEILTSRGRSSELQFLQAPSLPKTIVKHVVHQTALNLVAWQCIYVYICPSATSISLCIQMRFIRLQKTKALTGTATSSWADFYPKWDQLLLPSSSLSDTGPPILATQISQGPTPQSCFCLLCRADDEGMPNQAWLQMLKHDSCLSPLKMQ